MEKFVLSTPIALDWEFDIIMDVEVAIAIRVIDYLNSKGNFEINQKDVSKRYHQAGMDKSKQIIELKIRVDLSNATPVYNLLKDVGARIDLQEIKY